MRSDMQMLQEQTPDMHDINLELMALRQDLEKQQTNQPDVSLELSRLRDDINRQQDERSKTMQNFKPSGTGDSSRPTI